MTRQKKAVTIAAVAALTVGTLVSSAAEDQAASSSTKRKLTRASSIERHAVDLSLNVVDAVGASVPTFEAMLHSHQDGFTQWQEGRDGKIRFGAGDVQSLRLINDPSFQGAVRATGFAPVILRLEDGRQPMSRTVTMTPGRLISLAMRSADGRPIPERVKPLVVFDDFAARVRMAHMPSNIRPGRVVDFEMSNVERITTGQYQFRIATNAQPFFLFIDHPGFLRAYDSAFFVPGELREDRIEWTIPAAARLQATFDVPPNTAPSGYAFSVASLARSIPDAGKLYELWRQESKSLSFDTTLSDLPPGLYRFSLMLLPPQTNDTRATQAVPRAYTDEALFDLQEGERKTLRFTYAPPDPDAWRGDATARIKVTRHSGEPAAGDRFSVAYVAPHLGEIEILSGKLDTHGQFQLSGVRAGSNGPEFFLEIGGQWRQRFQMKDVGQQLHFTLPPQEKDHAPDCTFADLQTLEPVSLRSLRGSVIYLEFWATWCGPCQAPLAQLNQMMARKEREWTTNAHVLAVSIDETSELARRHVEKRGWEHVRHVWAGKDGGTGWDSPAAKAFGITGVPTAILIDPAGRIVWRGHPKDEDCEVQIGRMIPPARNDRAPGALQHGENK